MGKLLGFLFVVVLIAFGAWWWYTNNAQDTIPLDEIPPEAIVSTAHFECDADKTVDADFYENRVELTLSDGRGISLMQTMAASGTRYANDDESFVFWNKSNTATIEESATTTYIGCISVAQDPGNLPQIYASSTAGFSIRYPSGWLVDETYESTDLGPGKEIPGVAFGIPATMASGTNLAAADTGLRVEWQNAAGECTAERFLADTQDQRDLTEGTVTYSVGRETGAAAGNIYEQVVYAIRGTTPCMALRYFVHSTNIQNYATGTVREFDRTSLLNLMDAMRKTFVPGQ